MGELLQRLGDRYLLVLHIDDLQWGDIDSVALITSFMTAPDPPRLLLIASYRNEDRGSNPCLAAFLDIERQSAESIDWRTIDVEPLSFDESKELAALLLPTGGSADVERVARESRGSPYFVHELVTYTRDPNTDETTSGDLDSMLANRVARLSLPAQRLLQIVALAGKPVPLDNAFDAAALADEAPAALGVLRAEHLVRTTGAESDLVETYHDRVRESVAARLSDTVAREHHHRLAQSLEASGSSDVEAIALHFHRAGDLEQAAGFYAQAGARAATALAFDRAAELFKVALDLPGGSPERHRELRIARADALANGGRGVDAAHEYLAAAQGADARTEHTLLRQAGYQFSISGHIDEGREQFRQVLSVTRPAHARNAPLGVAVAAAPSGAGAGPGRPLHVEAGKQRVERRARPNRRHVVRRLRHHHDRPDPRSRLPDAKSARGAPRRRAVSGGARDGVGSHAPVDVEPPLQGPHEPLAAAPRRSWPISCEVPHAQGMAKLSRGVTSFFFGEFDVCHESCEEAEAIFSEHCTGVAWELDTCHAFAFWSLYYSGQFDELIKRLDRLLAQARERGARLAEADVTTFGGPFVWLARDDPDGAESAASIGDAAVVASGLPGAALHATDGERADRALPRRWRRRTSPGERGVVQGRRRDVAAGGDRSGLHAPLARTRGVERDTHVVPSRLAAENRGERCEQVEQRARAVREAARSDDRRRARGYGRAIAPAPPSCCGQRPTRSTDCRGAASG